MGRRKTKKIKQSKSSLVLKNRNKIDKEFHCNKCQHDKSVSIKIDMRSAVGFLKCRICGVDFSTRITSLDEPIDVYTAWIDDLREREKHGPVFEQPKPIKQDNKASPKETYERPAVDDTANMLSSDEDENVYDPIMEKFEVYLGENRNPNMALDELNKTEPDDSKAGQVNSHNTDEDFTKFEYKSYDDLLNITKNNFRNRVVGTGDLSSSFEHSENPDTYVHNLFQDED
ncbi:uncharacterized protein TOT_030000338 [Theileria orientalis strain Shintoku]|uniref:Transcription elongation factor 1 homolog n=1 Tax=Theileria orientalis strain Shintoku TaxID=869250 RepID=J4CDG0_THEOR|nr:uncharacterized protein TOT_030000338 [Theileria orientalis strain Shintoku]PVC54412.1 hypothetical protein MACL_00003087 [Theileria orientalis]BAM41077.1 uncharacterized protein TOT_030000338 [Theileria orientalis strain Shintoku]|eukprot:XP_009691378.1 uncharacterized protein TOT_030000338 [Theileria orientalis strain Shintoku]